MGQLVLDSHALLSVYFNEKGAEKVKLILKQGQLGKVHLYINEINLGEIYYRIAKQYGEIAAEEETRKVYLLMVELVPVDRAFILAAARWKGKYAISYADAFAVETAVRTNAQLVTGDPEFTKIREIEIVRV